MNESNVFALRQLSGVLFKQYVEQHWSQNSEKFQEPEIPTNVKQHVKQVLPLGLKDQSSKIRTTVAFAIAVIAQWDWPEQWAELFPLLISALNTANVDLNAVHGALETLTEIVQEVTDIQIPQVSHAIMPQIYKIFIDPQNYSINLRKRSLEIFTSLVSVVAAMAEYDSVS